MLRLPACYGLVQYSRSLPRSASAGPSCRQTAAATATNSRPTTLCLLNAAFAGTADNAGRSCRCLATQADGRGLSARVRRSCQVRVRAVYLLRAGATRLIPCIQSRRLLTRDAEETQVPLCCEAPLSRSLFSLAQVARAGSSASLEALSTPLRRRRSTPSSILGRFECVRDPIAVRDPLS